MTGRGKKNSREGVFIGPHCSAVILLASKESHNGLDRWSQTHRSELDSIKSCLLHARRQQELFVSHLDVHV